MKPITATLLSKMSLQSAATRRSHQEMITNVAAPAMEDTFVTNGINSYLRVAHFLAQLCEESDGFCTTEEYASGEAYEGRSDLGNTQPGDGVRFKGRGLIMITGRSNYSIYGAHLDLPLIAQPELAADPKHAVAIAIAFWNAHGLSTFADEDDIRSVTRRINGGLNGLLTRQLYLARIKRMLLPPVEPAAMV